MARDALSKAIAREERRQKTTALNRVKDRFSEGDLIAKGTSAIGTVAGAVHDKLRGESGEVAKIGPVPANLAFGIVGVGAALLIPEKYVGTRAAFGGTSMGLALAGVYRLTFDNWPEGDEG